MKLKHYIISINIFDNACLSDDLIGQTPLCIAAFHGHEEIVKYFLQVGADINGKKFLADSVDTEVDNVDWRVCEKA